jgi:hypothetical protein
VHDTGTSKYPISFAMTAIDDHNMNLQHDENLKLQEKGKREVVPVHTIKA